MPIRFISSSLITAAVLVGQVLAQAQDAARAPVAVVSDTALVALAGVWNLDPNASDDLAAFFKQMVPARREAARGDRGPGGGGRGPGGGGGPGRGFGGPPEGMGGGPDDGRQPPERLETERRGGARPDPARAARRLLIAVDARSLEIVDADDRSQVWVLGVDDLGGPSDAQRPDAPPAPGGSGAVGSARWDKGVLVLAPVGGPLAVARRLKVSADGRQLQVGLVATGADGKVHTANLIYAAVR